MVVFFVCVLSKIWLLAIVQLDIIVADVFFSLCFALPFFFGLVALIRWFNEIQTHPNVYIIEKWWRWNIIRYKKKEKKQQNLMGYLALEKRYDRKKTHKKSLDTIALTLRSEHPSDNQRMSWKTSRHRQTQTHTQPEININTICLNADI